MSPGFEWLRPRHRRRNRRNRHYYRRRVCAFIALTPTAATDTTTLRFYTANGLVRTNALRTSGIPVPAVHWRREWKAKGKGRHSLSEGSVDFFAFGFVPSRLGGDRKWSAMLQYTEGKTAKTRGSQRWYGRGSHCSYMSVVEYHSAGKVALNTPPEVSPVEFCPVGEDDYPEFEIGDDKGEMVRRAAPA